ncbi:MAG: hypothetical protein IJ729_03575 [Alloprevotella sp.]|nr:hypothetical protein [Alloprevotella sp.]
MKDETKLDGALCAGVGTADAAEGAVPAAGRKKYVSPAMQVIPLDPQRLLATSGGLPIYDICTGQDYDPQFLGSPGGSSRDFVEYMLSTESLMSDPVGFVSWANRQSWTSPAPLSDTIAGLPGSPTLGELLQSAVLTNVTSESRVGQHYPHIPTYTVDWTFILEGYVPGEYSFTVYGSYGSGAWYLAGGEHCYSEY